MKPITKEDLVSKEVSTFAYKHEEYIFSLCLSKDKKTLFSGCDGGILALHCVESGKTIGEPQQLDMGSIFGMEQNSNLLLVGGFNKFGLFKIPEDRGIHFMSFH